MWIQRCVRRLNKKRSLHEIIRGYCIMQGSGGIRFYRDLVSTLVNSEFPNVQASCSKTFFGDAYPLAEISIRQFLLVKLINATFHNSICSWRASGKPIRYPLPLHWQNLLRESGVEVHRVCSSLLFLVFVLLTFFRNIKAFLIFQIKSFQHLRSKATKGSYIFFANLGIDNLPKSAESLRRADKTGVSYDLCSWYHRRFFNKQPYECIGHDLNISEYPYKNVSVRSMPYPWFFIQGLKNKVNLLFFMFWTAFISFIELIRGRWWFAVMLNESGLAKAVSMVDRNQLAIAYLFPYSASRFRPLWTYSCEMRGSSVIAFFYSTYEQPMSGKSVEARFFDYGAITWSKLHVWTESQRESILEANRHYKPDVSVVGPIWFVDSGDRLDLLPRNGVAVFPVAPHRLVFHRPQSTNGEWIAAFPNLYKSFMIDIAKVLRELNLNMFVKAKREIGVREKKSTKMLHADLARADNVYFLNSGISAFRLMECAVASISIPFTAAALCGPSPDYPSIYYDPTGWIAKSDSASNGIPVITGIDELRVWSRNLILN